MQTAPFHAQNILNKPEQNAMFEQTKIYSSHAQLYMEPLT